LTGQFRNILIFVLSLVIFGVIYQTVSQEKESLQSLQNELVAIQKDGLILQDLRERWDSKTRKQKQLDRLRRAKPEIKKRGDKVLFKFEEPMNRKDFQKLAREILRSTIPIERIVIDKVDQYTVVVSVEVEK
jgi:hypothetical protein